ncbi:four helix bundle protein [Allomuricauda sp. F6463D]|uniref:four helix bundle protein n=1 Tax=Allomuricauda sp. F6463D TaxID=2926409 RepID=UPI001FF68470|nr:four helix bundle protein [Muricauda sp. F6463D]MCK0162033.1 four helix bundle protein [Muricauda sp. F6463D]
MGNQNIIHKKSFDFALEIVRMAKYMEKEQKEFVLSRQLLRSGTAIGALVREAEHAESKKDFIHKMSIALKEANETRYWMDLLSKSGLIGNLDSTKADNEIEQIIRLLAAIVKSSKRNYSTI